MTKPKEELNLVTGGLTFCSLPKINDDERFAMNSKHSGGGLGDE